MVRIERRYYRCRVCAAARTPWDEWCGLGKERVSVGVRRLACLAASAWSFDQAARSLREMCGLSVSDETIRRVCRSEGPRAAEWLATPAAAEPVQRAAGNDEWLVDGAMVNTRAGWHEMRLFVQSKREEGDATDPAQWRGLGDRVLPKPAAQLVTAHFADCEEMGRELARAARLAGFPAAECGGRVSVIADGAKWIWNQVGQVLPRAERVVDVYHVSQHLHQCSQALHPDSELLATQWAHRRLAEIVRQGPSVCLWQVERQAEAAAPDARRALLALAEYLRPNLSALRYGDRLRRGLTIGSGQVESACKAIVGRRLKINGARWNKPMARGIASLCSLRLCNLWEAYWRPAAA